MSSEKQISIRVDAALNRELEKFVAAFLGKRSDAYRALLAKGVSVYKSQRRTKEKRKKQNESTRA